MEAQLLEATAARDRLVGELTEAKRRATDALTDARQRGKAEAAHADQKLRGLVAQVTRVPGRVRPLQFSV